MKPRVALGAVLIAVIAGTGCSRTSVQAVGRLTVSGQAEVTTNDGGLTVVTGSRTLRSGEHVQVTDGTATLGLGQGNQLELRKDSKVRLVVRSGAGDDERTLGEVVAGDVLVTGRSEAAEVMAGDTSVRVSGAARVSRNLAVVVATYEGEAEVESVARRQTVPALRQVTVPAPGVPSRVTPLAFSSSDSWDQRYLGEAADLGNQLMARSRGITGQVPPGTDTGEAFLRQILPGLRDQPFDASLLDRAQPVGETLVGAAITLEGARGAFRERWADVFRFRAEGASWGLVALDQAVARQPLLAQVDAATGRLPGLGTQSTNPSPVDTRPTPVPVPVPTTLPPTGGAQSVAPSTPPSTVVANNGSAQPPPPGGEEQKTNTVNTGVPPVDDTANAVVDLLTGLLRSVGPR